MDHLYLLFADDIKIYLKIDSLNSCLLIQSELNIFSSWSNTQVPSLNKYHVLSFQKPILLFSSLIIIQAFLQKQGGSEIESSPDLLSYLYNFCKEKNSNMTYIHNTLKYKKKNFKTKGYLYFIKIVQILNILSFCSVHYKR